MKLNKISDYIENLPLQKSFCNGYRPDEVYDVICNLSSMYNQILSEAYEENDELRKQLLCKPTDNINTVFVQNEEELTTEVEDLMISFEDRREESMNDKELQKLKRGELLEILLEESRENETLKNKLAEATKTIRELNNKLENRRIDIKEAGSIADASLKLNGVFDAAQKAAQQYLDNLQELYRQEAESFSEKETEIENKCAAMLQATKERCDFMKEAMEKECRRREEEAEANCRALDEKAKMDVDKRWEDLAKRLEEFYNAHEGLKDLMAASKII